LYVKTKSSQTGVNVSLGKQQLFKRLSLLFKILIQLIKSYSNEPPPR